MDFIDNIDSELTTKRRELDVLADLSDIVHAGVGCAVDLDDIHRISQRDFTTILADVTGVAGGSLCTIEGFGKDSGHGRFSNASRTGK